MNAAQTILVFLVRLYRWTLSPLKTAIFGPYARCRFTPSCSAYALQALRWHGAWRGTWLALRRLVRCHPWGGCGEDPVPPPAKLKNHRGCARGNTGGGPDAAHSGPAMTPSPPLIH